MSVEAAVATRAEQPVRRRKWVVRSVSVILLAFFVVAVWWFSHRSKLQQRYSAIRAAGHPVTLEELNEYYSLPAGAEDDTELWIDALSLSEKAVTVPRAANLPVVGNGPDIPSWGKGWAEKDQVAAFLSNHAEAITAIHTAAHAGGGVRLPQDFRDGIAPLLTNLGKLRSGFRLLTLEFHLRARNGDTAGAIESLDTLFAVGRTLDSHPLLVSFMTRTAIDGIAIGHASQLLPVIEPSREELLAIQDALQRIDYHAELENALIGERSFGMNSFGGPNVSGLGGIPERFIDFVATRSKVKYIDVMNQALSASSQPWQVGIFNEPWLANWDPNSTNSFDRMVSILFPSLDSCFLAGGRQEARRLSLEAAIAAELYRRDYGNLPETLDNLVPDYLPAVPTDPFNGEPLRYVVNPRDFVIYALGEDLNDDLGSVEEQPDGYPLDVGVRWIVSEASSENPK